MGHDPRVPLRLVVASLLILAAACPDEQNASVSVAFRARVGAEPFECGATYGGLGTAASDVVVRDFRMYVHDVSLVRSDGVAVPIALDESGPYQHSGVAFLDFSAGAGAECDDPTAETNAVVTGQIPEGVYDGISFVVGIPFEINHANNATAPPPLNVTSMYWDWFAGYKFIRVDGEEAGGNGVLLHLGSTGCTPGGMGGVGACTNENRPEITLSTFNPEGHAVIVDLAGLFAGSDLETSGDGATACMAEPENADCGPMFGALGLPFGGTPGPEQTVFRVEAR
jgi:uncharacterized repeat protein (TIGR04052 family)